MNNDTDTETGIPSELNKKRPKWGVKQALRWTFFNALFLFIIYLALFEQIEGAARASIFLIHFATLITMFGVIAVCHREKWADDTKTKKEKRKKQRDAERMMDELNLSPAWLSYSIDFALLLALAWHGWVWCLLVYMVHFFSECAMRSAINEYWRDIKQKQKQDELAKMNENDKQLVESLNAATNGE